MSDTDATGLWPKPDTLAAGDEAGVKTSRDYLNDRYPDPRSNDDDDGHLENDAYRKKHPDA